MTRIRHSTVTNPALAKSAEIEMGMLEGKVVAVTGAGRGVGRDLRRACRQRKRQEDQGDESGLNHRESVSEWA